MNHAVNITTKGILGGFITAVGYVTWFTVLEPVIPPEPPITPIPYVGLGGMGGGGSSAIGRLPKEDDKIIKILFVYDGKEYECVGSINKDVMIMLEDLVVVQIGGKPTVAIKEESLRRVDSKVSMVAESLSPV